jgi:hypothetical protein
MLLRFTDRLATARAFARAHVTWKPAQQKVSTPPSTKRPGDTGPRCNGCLSIELSLPGSLNFERQIAGPSERSEPCGRRVQSHCRLTFVSGRRYKLYWPRETTKSACRFEPTQGYKHAFACARVLCSDNMWVILASSHISASSTMIM